MCDKPEKDRRAMRTRTLLLPWIFVLAACAAEPDPYLIVTSDTHLSNPDGRWPQTVRRFQDFLTELTANPPELLFIVGDVVDNVRSTPDGGPRAGDKAFWAREVQIYKRAQSTLPGTRFLQSLGPGHDYIAPVTLEEAEKAFGARNGSVVWRGRKLIWLTMRTAAFRLDGRNFRNGLSDAEYAWLDRELATAENAILLFHVPLRTDLTFRFGNWPGGLHLTVDPRDRIYPIIDRHAPRIQAIFNGHIHKFIKTTHRGIPLYLCPFYDNGCHCKVHDSGDGLEIKPVDCPQRGAAE